MTAEGAFGSSEEDEDPPILQQAWESKPLAVSQHSPYTLLNRDPHNALVISLFHGGLRSL